MAKQNNAPTSSRHPRTGEWVHYVSPGNSLDATAGLHRAALVTEAGPPLQLRVFPPGGWATYNVGDVPHDPTDKTPGTWHFID